MSEWKVTFHSNSKAETVIHNADIKSVFESICSMIMAKIQKIRQEARVEILAQ